MGPLVRGLTPAGRPRQHLLALGLFLAASLALFGPPVLPHFQHAYVANSSDDAKVFAWVLTWWPHAVAHGLNPLYPHVIWAPAGYNLAWGTGVPGPSLLLAPLTATAGAIATYNVLALTGPALAAFTAYLLCRYVTGAFWPSVAGGYLFGFSTYQLGQLQSHLDLYLVFLVPLCALLVLKHHRGVIGTRRFVVLLALCLVGQFSISTEVFATLTLFGGVALAVGWLALRGESRARLVRTAGWVAAAFAVTAVVVSPYLYAMARYPQPVKTFHPLETSSDLAAFVVPSQTTWVGQGAFAGFTRHFTGSLGENGAYFGIPLLIVLGVFAVTRWQSPATRWLTVAFLAFTVLSLGPKLKLDGHPTVVMPWKAMLSVPLVGRALPARVTMYAWLVAGIAVAIWLAAPGRWVAARWGTILLSVALLLPNLPSGFYHDRPTVPRFFTDGTAVRELQPGETVMVIGDFRGDAMLWQAESWMRFSIPFGYLGLVPPDFRDPGLAISLSFDDPPSVGRAAVDRFLRDHHVTAVVLANARERAWERLIGGAVAPTDGVVLIRIRGGG